MKFGQDTDQVSGPSSGSMTLVDSSEVSEVVTYSGVAAVTDSTNSTADVRRDPDHRRAADPPQHHRRSGRAADDRQQWDGRFCAWTFADPSAQLILDGGAGGNTFVVNSLDAAFTATGPAIDINGGAGNDNLLIGSGVQPFNGVFASRAATILCCTWGAPRSRH